MFSRLRPERWGLVPVPFGAGTIFAGTRPGGPGNGPAQDLGGMFVELVWGAVTIALLPLLGLVLGLMGRAGGARYRP